MVNSFPLPSLEMVAPELSVKLVVQTGKTAIPLSAVASVDEVEGPAEIRRSDGDRVAVITANLVGRDLASVSEEIAAGLEAYFLGG